MFIGLLLGKRLEERHSVSILLLHRLFVAGNSGSIEPGLLVLVTAELGALRFPYSFGVSVLFGHVFTQHVGIVSRDRAQFLRKVVVDCDVALIPPLRVGHIG